MLDPVRSVEQYLSELRTLTQPKGSLIRLHRGQSRDWPLLPKLFRPPDESVSMDDSLWTKHVQKAEMTMLNHLKNDSPFLLPSKPDNDWDWLSMGQHYGLATRLTDWTANPLTGFFFAVENPLCPKPMVYVYDAMHTQQVTDDERRKDASPLGDIKQSRVLQPTSHSQRVALQAGWHIVHRLHKNKSNGGWKVLPLEKMDLHRHRLQVLEISPGHAGKIRAELNNMGVYHATIYGTLESVCHSINQSNSFPRRRIVRTISK
jgi:hypothetical protein